MTKFRVRLLACCTILIFLLSGCGKGKDLDASVAHALAGVIYSWESPKKLDIDLVSIESISDYSDYIAGIRGQSDDFDIFTSLAWKYYEWNLIGEAYEWIERSDKQRVDFREDLEVMLLSLCGKSKKLDHSLKRLPSIPIGKDAALMISNREYVEGVTKAVKMLRTNASEIDKRRYYIYADFISKVIIKEDFDLPLDLGNEFFDPLLSDFVGKDGWETFVNSLKSGSTTYVQTVLLDRFGSILGNASVYFERIEDLDRSKLYRNRLKDVVVALQKSDDKRSGWFSYLSSEDYRLKTLQPIAVATPGYLQE